LGTSRRSAVGVVPEDYSYVFNPYREPIACVEPGRSVMIHTDNVFVESRINTPPTTCPAGRSPPRGS
jgi:hypothetical protein